MGRAHLTAMRTRVGIVRLITGIGSRHSMLAVICPCGDYYLTPSDLGAADWGERHVQFILDQTQQTGIKQHKLNLRALTRRQSDELWKDLSCQGDPGGELQGVQGCAGSGLSGIRGLQVKKG